MEVRPRNILLIVLYLFLAGTVAAQQDASAVAYDEQAQKKFDYGLLQYELKAWDNAARQFEAIIRDMPLNHRTTAAYVMAARCRLFQGRASAALRLVEEFLAHFPQSRYMAEACLVAGDAGGKAGSRLTALLWYLRSWNAEGADTARLRRSIAAIQPDLLTPVERRSLRAEFPTMQDSTLVSLLGHDEREGRASPDAADAEGVRAVPHAKSDIGNVLPIRIAAVLPMHEHDPRRAAVVRDLRDGMLSALDLHRGSNGCPVSFELIGSSSEDSLRSAIARCERDERTLVLIAGAFSDDAEAVAEMTAEKGMLVLLPTATAEGLTRTGSNIFQLNTPILRRASLLADFAYLELDAKEAVVLAPSETYAWAMGEAFFARCEELGLRVRFTGWYGDDADEAAALCRKAAALGVKNGILFAPVQSRDDIVRVLEGMRQTNLQLPLVGGGNWNHADLIVRHADDRTLYFEADVVADTTAPLYRSMLEAYARRNSRPPSREALFGFDAMRIALSVAGRPNSTREDVRKRIMDVFDGLRAPVNFLSERVNAAMNIIECHGGRLHLQEAFHAK